MKTLLGKEVIDTKTKRVGTLHSVENEVATIKIGKRKFISTFLKDLKYTSKIFDELFTDEDMVVKLDTSPLGKLASAWVETNNKKMSMIDFFLFSKKILKKQVQIIIESTI